MATHRRSRYGRPHQRAKAEMPPPSGPCPYCGEPMVQGEKVDADHPIPLALGGGGGPLRWAHARCNRAAGARLGNRLHGWERDLEPVRWIDRWS